MAVINAITGSNADIQDACNAASDGDTVLIPSGTFACEGTITIQDKNLHIRGDSKTTTILERNVESSSKSMFYVPMYGQTGIEFSDMTLHDKNGPYGTLTSNKWTRAIHLNYGAWDFSIHDIKFEGWGYAAVACYADLYSTSGVTSGKQRGVVYNCDFVDCYGSGLGYGVLIVGTNSVVWADDDGKDLGSANFVFVEDCTFSNTRHVVTVQYGGRGVGRYNTVTNHPTNARSFDVHGYNGGGQHSGYAWEFYENDITSVDAATGGFIGANGGDGVIYNNSLTVVGGSNHEIYLKNGQVPPAVDYPCPEQIRDTYVWGNTLNGGAATIRIYPEATEELLQLDRDYYESQKQGYTAYDYPHPLRSDANVTVDAQTISTALSLPLVSVVAASVSGWLSGWNYRKKITISNTNVASDLAHCPVYVPISADSDIGANASDTTNGYDIRFAESDGETLLDYERIYFNVAAGDCTAHYMVSNAGWTVTTASATEIYIYYNDGDGSVDGENATGVWDANYVGVWHLTEGTGTAADSSGEGNPGTFGGDLPTPVAGKVYLCQDFELDTSDVIVIGSAAELDMAGNNITMEALFKLETDANAILFSKNYDDYEMYYDDAGKIYLNVGIDDGNYEGFASADMGIDVAEWWYAGGAISSAGAVTAYVGDGSSWAEAINTSTSGTVDLDYVATRDLQLGRRGAATNKLDGTLDECRLSNTVRNEAWRKFTAYNVLAANNELSWGAHVPQTIGVDVSASAFSLTATNPDISVQAFISVETVYIDATDGDDDNDGFYSQEIGAGLGPWKTLGRLSAVGGITPGGFIKLKAGETWSETLTVPVSGTAAGDILITSYGTGADPIIDGQSTRASCIDVNEQDYVHISKLITTGATTQNFLVDGDNNHVRRCIARDGDAIGINVSGDSNSIDYNILHDNGDDGVVNTGSSNAFYNLVVEGSGAAGFDADESCTIRNCIMRSNTGDDMNIASAKTVTGGYNCFEDAAVAGTGTYTNTATSTLFATNPLFTNPSGDIFTLQTASPCQSVGLDVSLTTDYAGSVVAPPPDIGAYENLTSSSNAGHGLHMYQGMGM